MDGTVTRHVAHQQLALNADDMPAKDSQFRDLSDDQTMFLSFLEAMVIRLAQLFRPCAVPILSGTNAILNHPNWSIQKIGQWCQGHLAAQGEPRQKGQESAKAVMAANATAHHMCEHIPAYSPCLLDTACTKFFRVARFAAFARSSSLVHFVHFVSIRTTMMRRVPTQVRVVLRKGRKGQQKGAGKEVRETNEKNRRGNAKCKSD